MTLSGYRPEPTGRTLRAMWDTNDDLQPGNPNDPSSNHVTEVVNAEDEAAEPDQNGDQCGQQPLAPLANAVAR
jgi:hypothetical protein